MWLFLCRMSICVQQTRNVSELVAFKDCISSSDSYDSFRVSLKLSLFQEGTLRASIT